MRIFIRGAASASWYMHDDHADVISATANPWYEYSPLKDIASRFKLREEMLCRASRRVNRLRKPALIYGQKIRLILVPKNVQDEELTAVLADIGEHLSECEGRHLHMTHFSEIRIRPPLTPITEICRWATRGPTKTLNSLSLDIDQNHLETVLQVQRNFFSDTIQRAQL
jgi:hypothetical protein